MGVSPILVTRCGEDFDLAHRGARTGETPVLRLNRQRRCR
jgi:hypothetical protein